MQSSSNPCILKVRAPSPEIQLQYVGLRNLLQTPLEDYRKFVVWRILTPYLINIRKCSADEAYGIIGNWLDKCSHLRRLQFNPKYMIKYNINPAKNGGYLPISLEKLKIENPNLYNVVNI